MKAWTRGIAAVTAALLALWLAACGSTQEEPSAANSSAGFPRTIQHDKGTTTLTKKPERIVALDNSLVEAVVLLGRPVVGGVGSYRNQQGFPSYLGDAVKDTKDLGPLDNPNLELLATLKPDLIVSATVRHDALYDKLSAIAPTVFVKTTGPIWKDNIRLLGQALGEETRATDTLAKYESRAKKIGDAINAKHNKPTISIVRFVDGPTRIYLNKSFSGIVLKDAGLARPANQDKDDFNLEISEEQIGQADADYLFVTAFTGGEDRKKRFMANPLWQRLTAVQNGHVYSVDDALWMTSVSVQGAHAILDDLAGRFAVDPAR
ncbi:iron-siderophore ABC transporter substrate-binding protein [Planosporangium flavigriseum]|uniref:Iron siderophore-binding protein n=1 Tax=Planosporangium flavigriseum TaxID=373681 RepID=A0A8J3LSK5_9ACTN|nr:iron-siderophore ABC transporter substrate-binding protein [Planosporangium flavigriseum]NJC65444.1 iron-siderophore ABC transporter substrate-binding protein [Planosporangium flavigriseum]GIG75868.1 iron siderophore-binding protein [Planosporangium flavigriseum]